MSKTQLRKILKRLLVKDRDALDNIIINGQDSTADIYSKARLIKAGLLAQRESHPYFLECSYMGGPISEFFEVNMALDAEMAKLA